MTLLIGTFGEEPEDEWSIDLSAYSEIERLFERERNPDIYLFDNTLPVELVVYGDLRDSNTNPLPSVLDKVEGLMFQATLEDPLSDRQNRLINEAYSHLRHVRSVIDSTDGNIFVYGEDGARFEWMNGRLARFAENPIQYLQESLDDAVAVEDYETATRFRDSINRAEN